MFSQMTIDEEEVIKQTGQLNLQVNPFIDFERETDKMEHVIVYRNSQLDCYPSSIFRCLVTRMLKCLMLEDLTLRTRGVSPLSEQSLHLFLGWVIEDAPKWARSLGKKHVLIQTKLPHCTEWFIEHDYDIRPLGDGGKNGYSGLKIFGI